MNKKKKEKTTSWWNVISISLVALSILGLYGINELTSFELLCISLLLGILLFTGKIIDLLKELKVKK